MCHRQEAFGRVETRQAGVRVLNSIGTKQVGILPGVPTEK
jgi:hypothetical protein